MTVRDSTTLKSYFNLTNVPTPSNYMDLIDTLFAQGSAGVDGDHNHDDRYVQLSIANTISAVHIFSPSVYSPPFILGSNAQGQTVVGLKADQLNKSVSVSGLGLSGGGALTANQTITLTSSSNPGAAASILATDASGYLSLVRLKTDTIADLSGANLTISPAGDIVFDPAGNDLYPNVNYDLNLGLINKKFLTIHAAELWVETLVALSTIATIGGRILVGPTTILSLDLPGSQANLISNENFETAGAGGADVFASWFETAGNGAIAMDSTYKNGGTYSAKLTAGADTLTRLEQYFNATAGLGYTFSFWTRGDGTNAGRYGLWDAFNNNWLVSPTSTGVTGTNFTRVLFTVVAAPATTTIGLVLYCPGVNTGIVWFDDVGVFQDTMVVKHNEMAANDIVYMETIGQVEFIRVIAGPTGADPGPYTYSVARNLDGTGTNAWLQGDAVFNTGTTTEGFMDLYSLRGVKQATESTNYGPTIVGNVRNSLVYNDWSEHWAIGNLNTLYGYGVTTYGFAAGKYATGVASSFITADATNGFRTISRSVAGVNTTRFQVSVAGVLTINDGGGAAVFTFDATTGAEFTKPLTLATTGGIYQGTGTFATPTTGLKIWNESGIGRIGGYYAPSGTGVLQWYAGTNGKLYAGGGKVWMDASGIVMEAGGDTVETLRAYKFYDVNVAGYTARIFTYADSSDTLVLHGGIDDNVRNAGVSVEAFSGSSRAAKVEVVADNSTYNAQIELLADSTNHSTINLMATTINAIGNLIIPEGVTARFPHTYETDTNDGKIGAGLFSSEGLSIVGVQTAAAAGRKIQMWGNILLNGSISASTALGASVYNNANITLTSGQWTYLTFNSEWWDTNSIHDTGSNTGRLVCKTPGLYVVITNVTVAANATGVRALSITYNVGRVQVAVQSDLSPKSTDNSYLSVSVIMTLALNDYVEVSVYQNSGGNLNAVYANAYSPSFQMIRIA